jgi:phospholipid/cholesterol/gamma-HCH transport system substrate-binding protein
VKYSNELKVGTTIIVATIIFILGVRYFQDLPLFRGTYQLTAEFDDAVGLIAGNVVRTNGVVVGGIDAVFINPTNQRVRVQFHVDSNLDVTEGSYAQISGFDALGAVRMDLYLGPVEGPLIPEGWVIPGHSTTDLLAEFSDTLPSILAHTDSMMADLETVMDQTGSLLKSPESDIRQTLSSVKSSVETLDSFLSAERNRLASILENVDSLAGNLSRISGENADSISSVVGNLNAVLLRLDKNLVSMEKMTDSLTEVLEKVNSGEGTLGRLVNDPAMYEKLDSTLSTLNALMKDFQDHPEKYLKELRLVDIL